MNISKELLAGFAAGEFGEIYLAYTSFKNTVSHEPKLLKLLPVEIEAGESDEEKTSKALMNFEPEDDQALDLIIPKYITSLIFGAMVEAAASENGARMQAMDSATSNAEEMISDLTLKYNREHTKCPKCRRQIDISDFMNMENFKCTHCGFAVDADDEIW